MNSKIIAILSIILMVGCTFIGCSLTSDDSDATDYGTPNAPLTSLTAYAWGSTDYYVAQGSLVTLIEDEAEEGEIFDLFTYGSQHLPGLSYVESGIYAYRSWSGYVTTVGDYTIRWSEYASEPNPDIGEYVDIELGSGSYVIHVVNPSYTHTIAYNGNGVTSGSTGNTVVTDANSGNSNVTLASNGFYKADYTFAGWSVNGVTYQPGTAISVGGNQTVTAYAVWSENTLTASAGNGEAVSNQAIGVQISAVANNGASLSYVIKSCSAGTASVSGGGACDL